MRKFVEMPGRSADPGTASEVWTFLNGVALLPGGPDVYGRVCFSRFAYNKASFMVWHGAVHIQHFHFIPDPAHSAHGVLTRNKERGTPVEFTRRPLEQSRTRILPRSTTHLKRQLIITISEVRAYNERDSDSWCMHQRDRTYPMHRRWLLRGGYPRYGSLGQRRSGIRTRPRQHRRDGHRNCAGSARRASRPSGPRVDRRLGPRIRGEHGFCAVDRSLHLCSDAFLPSRHLR